MSDALFTLSLLPQPFEAKTTSAQGSKRRKLWEISTRSHCPLIGVCFALEALRKSMCKVMEFSPPTSDYTLHTTAVGASGSRTRLAELLHKDLEKRYRPIVGKFSRAKRAEDVRALWREACDAGCDIPGALWASWSHPACDNTLETEIYRDIHMIQHQIGGGTRADLAALQAFKEENAQLRRQATEVRREAEAQRNKRYLETQRADLQISKLRTDLAGKEAMVANLAARLDALRQSVPDLKARQSLLRRASDAEARATALSAKAAELERETERLLWLARSAEETIEQLLAVAERLGGALEPMAGQAQPNLSGKCILCVGGRSGSVDAYRKAVEQRGGSFLHHDGGLEESQHRIDAVLAAADLVICQAGCISHNAYWRVKEQCKRTGKQCLYLKNAGASSFDRIVGAVCAQSDETVSV